MLTMFVTVLITSCQVSLQWNRGPVTIQARVIAQIAMNAELDPAALAVFWAIVVNQCFFIETPYKRDPVPTVRLIRGLVKGEDYCSLQWHSRRFRGSCRCSFFSGGLFQGRLCLGSRS